MEVCRLTIKESLLRLEARVMKPLGLLEGLWMNLPLFASKRSPSLGGA